MRLFLLLILGLGSVPAWAQDPIDPSTPRGRRLVANLDQAIDSPEVGDTISCKVTNVKPVLNFALRYQAGYRANFSIAQFPPEKVPVRVFIRVTAESTGTRTYLWQDFEIPEKPRVRQAEVRIGGGFFLGEGRYQVDWLMTESGGRICRDQWTLKLRLNESERESARFVPAGEVKPLILDYWSGPGAGKERPFRISIFVHAAPISPRSTRLSPFDRSLLLTTVTSLLEDTPFAETSVHVVNMQQQREIFRTQEFDGRALRKLVAVMEELELGTIDIEQLSKPDGHVDLLAGLVNEQISSPEPPDAIVFIGPNSRYISKFPAEQLESIAGRRPQFFYLNLDYYSSRFPFADTIESLVKGQRGKVFHIHDPKHFAEALRKIEARLAERSG